MRKGLLILSLVGLFVVATAGSAQAQRYGYGGMGGGRGYYPQASYYNNTYYGRGFSPYYQTYYQGYSNSYAPDYYYYGNPSYAVAPASYYAQPSPVTLPQTVQSFYSAAEATQQVATVSVVLPNADAQVWFGGTLTSQQGAERVYHSPTLAPGKHYTYAIKARWMSNGKYVSQDRHVDVRAGQRVTVDFRESPGKIVPPPDSARD